MASGSTPKRNIPYPLSTDNVNVQQDIQAIAEVVDNVLDNFGNEIDQQTQDLNTAIDTTIPALIDGLGLDSLLSGGLTWGELKGNNP
jgi:hypothetical protein